MPRYIIAAVEDIPPGARKIVEVADRSIGVFNINGVYYAIRNRCPHQGGPLCAGRQSGFLEADAPGRFRYTRRGEILRCPWHGWEFDITTGRSWVDPTGVRTRAYEATIRAGDTIERDRSALSDAGAIGNAETYPVVVDRNYVLVDIPSD